MKRIAYGETVVRTDSELADLVLRYATLLAANGTADTVVFPGSVQGGPVEPVSMLIGPASQLTAWEIDGAFEADAADAIEDLRRRILGLSVVIPTSDGPDDVQRRDAEELEGPAGA